MVFRVFIHVSRIFECSGVYKIYDNHNIHGKANYHKMICWGQNKFISQKFIVNTLA